MIRRLVGVALAALTLSMVSLPGMASAHTLASSSVRLVEGDDELTGTVTLAVASLDKAFAADRRSDVLSAEAYADQVIEYLDDHLTVDGADGTGWTEHYSNLVRQTTEGIETITVDVSFDLEGADPADFTITYDAVIEAVAGHEAVLVLETSAGSVSTPGVFSADHDTIAVGDDTSGVGISDMIGFGFHHVLDGADHLLFLLTLLLPAPFVAAAGRWRLRRGVLPAGRKVLHVVTAFTVGHSLTLVATSLGWISVPSRPVEVLIAVSVAVSAVHAVRPIVRGGERAIAAGFGLVHGLAFAGILHDLGLRGGTSTAALLSFNLGIELAQLAAVALTLPSLYVLSTRGNGDRVRVVGAAVALTASVAWILDRVGVLADPLAGAERVAIDHLWWVVAGLGAMAMMTAWPGLTRRLHDRADSATAASFGPLDEKQSARSY